MSQTVTTTTNAHSLKLVPTDVPKEIHRLDYKPPEYFVRHTELHLQLDYEETKVVTVLHLYRNRGTLPFSDLALHGEDTINLESVQLQLKKNLEPEILKRDEDFKIIPNHSLTIHGHKLPEDPDEVFKLVFMLTVNPSKNTELMGLYKAGPILCTQMEAEGFRRLTYCLDRPDVMSTYRVRLEAKKSTFPVLLSNGNQVEIGDLPDDRHFSVFDDPFPKPSYLVGIVAGNLALKEDSFIRSTGKPIRLSLWCEPKNIEKLDWAMEAIKRAMKWDEDRFGRVYDLEWFNIVAVSYFNMGAMENKSLNIFNTNLLLASKGTSTDDEFLRILGVVGHEYFHNWTGNRVTCRDWFQLTLKEGLTVYRDQEFSSDLGSRSVERIKNVLLVRSMQFAEDAGPLAHPIRPETYEQIDNFYTLTVYRKGAEVIRMYETILGREGFRKGMDLYFERHDGHAVTCDDFRAAMSDANNVDLTQFERWYLQAGTPIVTIEATHYDSKAKKFTFTLKQACNPSSKQPIKKPFHIPVAVGLIGRQSKKEIQPTIVLHFTDVQQTFVLEDVSEDPVLSIFRDFSAPVKVISSMEDTDYGLLMFADTDGFNRWEAGQKLLRKAILERAAAYRDNPSAVNTVSGSPVQLVVDGFKNIMKNCISDSDADLYYIAFFLLVPTVSTLMPDFQPCDPVAINKARKDIRGFLATQLEPEFAALYESLTNLAATRPWDLQMKSLGIRSLRNIALSYLMVARGNSELVLNHFKTADSMNDRLAALAILADYPNEEFSTALNEFLANADGDELVVDKWFSLQAGADHEHVLDRVKELKEHELFNMDNPNRMRSLILRFTLNPAHFHRRDGQGYSFVAEAIAELDKINGRMAAAVAKQLISWQTMDANRQELMKAQLYKLASLPLSGHCKEIVVKGISA